MARADHDRADASEGPTLPRMRDGLPATTAEACRELVLAVVIQGLTDDDSDFVLGDDFAGYCALLGLDAETVLAIRVRYCLNKLDVRRLDLRRVHAARFDCKHEVAGDWQSWPTTDARVLGR